MNPILQALKSSDNGKLCPLEAECHCPNNNTPEVPNDAHSLNNEAIANTI